MTQHLDPGATLSVLFLKLLSPASPQASLVHFSCPFARAQGKWLQQKFMHWPFKQLFASLAICLWHRETLSLFTAGCYLCTFGARVLLAGDPSLVFRPHPSQGDPTGHLNIPPVLQLLPTGAQPAFLCLQHTPYGSDCAQAVSSVCPWL